MPNHRNKRGWWFYSPSFTTGKAVVSCTGETGAGTCETEAAAAGRTGDKGWDLLSSGGFSALTACWGKNELLSWPEGKDMKGLGLCPCSIYEVCQKLVNYWTGDFFTWSGVWRRRCTVGRTSLLLLKQLSGIDGTLRDDWCCLLKKGRICYFLCLFSSCIAFLTCSSKYNRVKSRLFSP